MQYLFHRRRHGGRIVGGLCGLQRRLEYDDLVAGERALAPEIRVNAVCPGFAETRWLKEGLGESVYAQAKALYENNAPLHRVILPKDVARTVVWFLEGGDLVTGETLMVDSGFHLGMTAMKAR